MRYKAKNGLRRYFGLLWRGPASRRRGAVLKCVLAICAMASAMIEVVAIARGDVAFVSSALTGGHGSHDNNGASNGNADNQAGNGNAYNNSGNGNNGQGEANRAALQL